MKKQIKSTMLLGGIFMLTISATAQNVNSKNQPGINTSFMDKTVKPNDDFFNFVNGTWLKNTPIPADKTRWGSFE